MLCTDEAHRSFVKDPAVVKFRGRVFLYFAFRDDDGRAYLCYRGSADGGKLWYLSRREIIYDEHSLSHPAD